MSYFLIITLFSYENQKLNSNLNGISSNLGGLEFAQDENGNWGYRTEGADSVIPFKKNFSYVFSISQRNMSGGKSYMMVIQDLTTGKEKSASNDPRGWDTAISGSLTLDGVATISVYGAKNAQSGTETFQALKDLEIYTIDKGYQNLSSGQSITFSSGWQTAPSLVYVY